MPTGELYVHGNQGHSPGIEPPLLTNADYYSLRCAIYVSYLPSGSVTWGGGGAQRGRFVLSELGVLHGKVSSSSVAADRWSGVVHLKFFVLHRSVDALSEDAGLSGAVLGAKGGGECIATKLKQLCTFRDSLAVIGERGGAGT